MHWSLPGDGFVRLSPYSNLSIPALLQVPMMSSYQLAKGSITGMNVQTLEALRSYAFDQGVSFNIEYYWYRMNDNTSTQTSEIVDALRQYDCLFTNLIVDPERLGVTSFLYPHIPFTYQVMTTQPRLQTLSFYDRFYLIISPYTQNLWLALMCLVLCSSFFIGVFEGDEGVNDFEFDWWRWQEKKEEKKQKEEKVRSASMMRDDSQSSRRTGFLDKSSSRSKTFKKFVKDKSSSFVGYIRKRFDEWADRLGYGLFRGITVLIQGEGIHPVTVAGRIYMAGMAMCFLVVTASYTAQLTANFTAALLPINSVTTMDDFISQGSVCCVRNTTTHLAFMKRYYPSVQIFITDPTEAALAQAILDGSCVGAVSTGPHLRYFLNTNNLGCKMQLVGPPMSNGYYALSFNTNLSKSPPGQSSILDALNLLLVGILFNGNLDAITNSNFPSTPTIVCPLSFKSSTVGKQIDFSDLSGIFIIQGVLAGVGIVIHIISKIKRRHLEHIGVISTEVKGVINDAIDGTASKDRGQRAGAQEWTRLDTSGNSFQDSNGSDERAMSRQYTTRVGRRPNVARGREPGDFDSGEFDKARTMGHKVTFSPDRERERLLRAASSKDISRLLDPPQVPTQEPRLFSNPVASDNAPPQEALQIQVRDQLQMFKSTAAPSAVWLSPAASLDNASQASEGGRRVLKLPYKLPPIIDYGSAPFENAKK
jgi:hypothetical protein